MPFSIRSRASTALQYQPPAALRRNWVTVPPAGQARIAVSLKRHYFTRRIWAAATPTVDAWLASHDGQQDLGMHVWGRTDTFRRTVAPWLNEARPLAGARLLEIGCGTGTSTVAFAEQGARVTAVDLDAPSLRVAEDRLAVYGCDADLHQLNATEVAEAFRDRHFDVIVFVASLEHMLHAERIRAMANTWDMLPQDGLWCLADTPNRLWYFDSHTAWLPFYNWLPDDLALAYSRHSPRQPFASSYPEHTPDALESFLRHGRGISYHEFALAMCDSASSGSSATGGKPTGVEALDVVSSLPVWLRGKSPLRLRALAWRLGQRGRFSHMLARIGPAIHPGFYEPSLDLILRKPPSVKPGILNGAGRPSPSGAVEGLSGAVEPGILSGAGRSSSSGAVEGRPAGPVPEAAP